MKDQKNRSKVTMWSRYLAFLFLLFMSCEDQDDMEEKESQHSKAVLSYIETIWNKKELSHIDSFFISKFTRQVNNIETATDNAELAADINVLFTAFPDLNVTLAYIIPKDNIVFIHWNLTATNTGVYGDYPPTGNKIKISGTSRFDFDEYGKIISENVVYNELSLLQQLGYELSPPNFK